MTVKESVISYTVIWTDSFALALSAVGKAGQLSKRFAYRTPPEYAGFAGSPTTTNGAQYLGLAHSG